MNNKTMDYLNLFSLIIGLENLSLNVSQQDIQNQTQDLNIQFHKSLQSALFEIHSHLEKQDHKIDEILEKING